MKRVSVAMALAASLFAGLTAMTAEAFCSSMDGELAKQLCEAREDAEFERNLRAKEAHTRSIEESTRQIQESTRQMQMDDMQREIDELKAGRD